MQFSNRTVLCRIKRGWNEFDAKLEGRGNLSKKTARRMVLRAVSFCKRIEEICIFRYKWLAETTSRLAEIAFVPLVSLGEVIQQPRQPFIIQL